MKRAILVLPILAALALGGCSTDDFAVCSYRSHHHVIPRCPQPQKNLEAAQLAAATFPWNPLFEAIWKIAPYWNKDVITAVEKGTVEYEKSREFTLLGWRKAMSDKK